MALTSEMLTPVPVLLLSWARGVALQISRPCPVVPLLPPPSVGIALSPQFVQRALRYPFPPPANAGLLSVAAACFVLATISCGVAPGSGSWRPPPRCATSAARAEDRWPSPRSFGFLGDGQRLMQRHIRLTVADQHDQNFGTASARPWARGEPPPQGSRARRRLAAVIERPANQAR